MLIRMHTNYYFFSAFIHYSRFPKLSNESFPHEKIMHTNTFRELTDQFKFYKLFCISVHFGVAFTKNLKSCLIYASTVYLMHCQAVIHDYILQMRKSEEFLARYHFM